MYENHGPEPLPYKFEDEFLVREEQDAKEVWQQRETVYKEKVYKEVNNYPKMG